MKNDIRPCPPLTTSPTFLGEMEALLSSLPKSLHDRMMVLISACIDHGINTAPCLRRVSDSMGFTPKHFGMILTGQTGNDPAHYRWSRDADRRYSNL